MGLFALRHRLTAEDHQIISKWLRRRSPTRAKPGVVSAELRRVHRPRPRVITDSGTGDWYVVKTAPKGERKALDDLKEAGFEVYLPEFKLERFNRKKRVKITSTVPLFPRYLFARMERQHIAVARQCGSAIDILPGFPMDPLPVPAAVVEKLRTAQANLELDDTDEARRRRGETTKNTLAAMRKRLKGKPIKIVEGVFEGLPAEVEVVHSFERISVLVSIFGRQTAVLLEMDQVQELAA